MRLSVGPDYLAALEAVLPIAGLFFEEIENGTRLRLVSGTLSRAQMEAAVIAVRSRAVGCPPRAGGMAPSTLPARSSVAEDLGMESFLYLTTTGRTSGQPRRIEIWFVEHAGRYYIVSERREESGWVKNLLKEPRARFSVGTLEAPEAAVAATDGRGRVLSEDDAPDLVRAVRARMDAKYQWSDGLVVELAKE